MGKSVGTAVGAGLGSALIVGAGVGVLPIYPPDTQTAQTGNSEGNGRESEQTRKTRTIIRRRSDALKARARVTIKLPRDFRVRVAAADHEPCAHIGKALKHARAVPIRKSPARH